MISERGTNSSNSEESERVEQLTVILAAANDAVRKALRRHMLLGESVAVAGENGEVKILGPDEIRKLLEELHSPQPSP